MKIIKTILFLLCSQGVFSQINVKKEIELAAKQYEGMLASHQDLTQFPQSTNSDGSPRNMKSECWCSCFLGGCL